jgi:hypothetical protein
MVKNQLRHVHKANKDDRTYIKVHWSKRGGHIRAPRHLVVQHGLRENLCTSRNTICYNVTCPRSWSQTYKQVTINVSRLMCSWILSKSNRVWSHIRCAKYQWLYIPPCWIFHSHTNKWMYSGYSVFSLFLGEEKMHFLLHSIAEHPTGQLKPDPGNTLLVYWCSD